MKKLFKKLALMVVALLTFSVGSNYTVKEVKAADSPYSYTFTAKQFSANGTKTLGDVKWTLAGDGGYWDYDGTKGQQFGSKNKPYKTMSLTSEVFNNVEEIKINTSGASSTNAKLTTYVGSTQVGSVISLTSAAKEYTFTVDPSLTGEIVFSYTQSSKKAIYIKSFEITFSTGSEGETPVPSISLDVPTESLYVGNAGGSNTTTITATINDSDLTGLKWESSDESVATVSQDGVVTAVSSGETTIKVSLVGTDVSKSINITVFDYSLAKEVNEYLLLNATTISGLTGSYSNGIFSSDEIYYSGTQVDKYSGNFCIGKSTANFYNLNPYSKTVKQVVIEQSAHNNDYLNIDVYGAVSTSNLQEVASTYADTEIYDSESGENKIVRVYSFDNTNVKHINLVSNSANYTTSMANVWVEFVERSTVTFDVNGGDSLSVSCYNVRNGESIPVLNPTRNGYVFKGWKNGEVILSSSTLTVSEDVTYVAQWQVDFSSVGTMAQLDFGYTYSEEYKDTTVVAEYTGGTTTNMTAENNASLLNLDSSWNVTADKGESNNYPGLNKANDFRLYYNENGSNSLTFEHKDGIIYSITITFTDELYSEAEVYVGDTKINSENEMYIINSNSFKIVNAATANSKQTQVRISNININYLGKTTSYDTFKNVNIRYSATIPTELFADVEAYGFNIATDSKSKDYEVKNTTVVGDDTTFALVLSNITDYKTEITVTGYVVVDGERINLGEKTYSVESMIQYYIDYCSSLGLSSEQVVILEAFKASIA